MILNQNKLAMASFGIVSGRLSPVAVRAARPILDARTLNIYLGQFPLCFGAKQQSFTLPARRSLASIIISELDFRN